MTAEKLLNFTCFDEDNNQQFFLNYIKTKRSIEAKDNLYETLKFIDEQNLNNLKSHYPIDIDLKFYEYLPLERYFKLEKKDGLLNLLAQLKQYQLKALYNLDEAATIKQAKELLLVPLIDKMLNHKNIIATIIFLNRTSTTQISLELFLFCPDEDLSFSELGELTSSEVQTTFNCRLLNPLTSTY